MRNGFIINDLASVDGGVGVRLLVIGSPGHSHALNAHLNPGNLALALVLVMVIQFGQERRRTFIIGRRLCYLEPLGINDRQLGQ